MKIKVFSEKFTVCKLNKISDFNINEDFFFLSKTEDELSLVCKSANAPKNTIACEDNWCMIKFVESMEFSMVGVLAKISNLLANNNISIFAVSTYNTDYILIKSEFLKKAISILKDNDYKIIN